MRAWLPIARRNPLAQVFHARDMQVVLREGNLDPGLREGQVNGDVQLTCSLVPRGSGGGQARAVVSRGEVDLGPLGHDAVRFTVRWLP